MNKIDRRWEKDKLYIEIESVISVNNPEGSACTIKSNSQEFKDKFPDYLNVISNEMQKGVSKCSEKINEITNWANDNDYEWRQPSKYQE